MTGIDPAHVLMRGLVAICSIYVPDIALPDVQPIEEITVFAQMREQPSMDVPMAVSVLSGEQLAVAGVRDLFDVAQLIPALNVVQNTGPINTSFRIRRIGNEPNIPTFEPAVGLFIDGAVRTRSGLGMGNLFDVERIEVLRGPQNTLYGKNTTAGVIHILTRKPTREFELFGEATIGSFDAYDRAALAQFEGAISGPLTEGLSARLSGSYYANDHLTANLLNADDTDDMSRHAVRAQLLYTPVSNLDVRLILSRLNVDSVNAGDLDMNPGIAIASINAAFGVPCPSRVTKDRALCRNRAGLADLEANDATLDARYRRKGVTFTSISNYQEYDWRRDFDADQLNIDLVDLIDRQGSHSFSQELRLAAPASSERIQWIAGMYYQRDNLVQGDRDRPTFVLGPTAALISLPNGIPLGLPGNRGFRYAESESRHGSVFGAIDWNVTDRLSLAMGARWLTERKRSTIENAADHTTPSVITLRLLPASANAHLERDTSGSAWSLSARYQRSRQFMTYVSISRGFKSGGFNTRSGNVRPERREFGDETVISYEGGLKIFLADHGLQFDAAVFWTDYDDFQSAGFVGLQFLVNNAEAVRVKGFEADLRVNLRDNLVGGLSASYADARYEEYTGGACHYAGTPDNDDGTACVLSGSRLPLAPRWLINAYAVYENPLSSGTGFARIDWQWTSQYYTNQTLDPRHVQDDYSLLNLRAGWRRGRFEYTAWMRNVGNTDYVVQAGPSNLFADDPAFGEFLGAPRSFGLTFRAHW